MHILQNKWLFILAVLIMINSINSSIPPFIAYQGILTDNQGNPRPDDTHRFTFSFYESKSGGTSIWSQEEILPVSQGMFATFLGYKEPFNNLVKFDKPYWLGISVDDAAELKPRVPITSVGYCFYALRADSANYIKASNVQGKVKQAQIADTARYISASGVHGKVSSSINSDTASYAKNANITQVDSSKFADNAIQWDGNTWGETYPIADTASFIDAQNVNGQVSSSIIADTADIAKSVVEKIIDSLMIKAGGISSANLINGIIDNNKIKQGSVERTSVSPQFKAPYADTADAAKWIDGNVVINTIKDHLVPKGTIVMWSGLIDSIPSTWALCDGENGTPDLRDRFILQVSSAAENPGITGGSNTISLSEANLPSHFHLVSGITGIQSQDHSHSGTTSGQNQNHSHSGETSSNGNHTHGLNHEASSEGGGAPEQGAWSGIHTGSQTTAAGQHNHSFSTSGASQDHGHSFTTSGIDANHNHTISFNSGLKGEGEQFSIVPSYYKLAFIIKL